MVKNRIIIFAVACTICVMAFITGGLIFALKYKENNIDYGSKVGEAKIVSVSNSTTNQKIELVLGSSQNVNININLKSSVDGVVRVKIAPRFYDEFDNIVVVPNSLTYVFETSQGDWVSDESYSCFYFNESTKNISTLNFLKSVTIPNDSALSGYKLDFVVEADILQIDGIDYNNHPWKDNAPIDWLNKFKTYK